MRLLLARHGETDWNAAGRIQGQSDTALNARGQEQAKALARRLLDRGEQVERIYTSPQRRARETAGLAGELLGQCPKSLPALREISFGHWEGCSWPEIRARWPEEYWYCEADRLDRAPAEGETFREMLERVLPALGEITAGPERSVLVITHSAVIRGVRCWLGGGDFSRLDQIRRLENARWFEVDAGRVTEWAF